MVVFVEDNCVLYGDMFYSLTTPSFYLVLAVKAVMTVSISFIALYVGLLMKSSRAAMAASFLLIILMQ